MTIARTILSFVFIALALFSAPMQLDAIGLKPKPARMMDDAFKKVDSADMAVEDKDVEKGVALYREALDVFSAISRDYPLWNPELLDLKRSYCEHQLSMALDMSGDQNTPTPLPEPTPDIASGSGPDADSDEPDATPTRTLEPVAPVIAPNPADLATKEDLLEIIEDLQRQLKAKTAPKGDRELVGEYNKLSREHTDLQGEHSELQVRYDNLKKERDSLDTDSELSGKDKRLMKKQIEELTKNGVQLLNDKKQLQKEVAILKAEKDELKSLIADGGGSSFPSAVASKGEMAEGPPSPADEFASSPPPPSPTVESKPAAKDANDPVLFSSLAGKYKDKPPVLAPSRPAPVKAAPMSPAHQKLKDMIKSGKFGDAVREADMQLAQVPGDTQVLLMKGMAACRSGKFDTAVDALQALTAAVPGHENGWVLLGTAYMAQKNTWKASESFHKALAINPDSPEANYNMAQILVSVEDISAARQCYVRCLQAGGRRDAGLEKLLNR